MQWLILLAACFAATVIAMLIFACAAKMLCWMMRPAVRKWFVIFWVMFFWSCVAISIWLGLTLPHDDSLADSWRSLKSSYESLPTWTLFRYVPLACGAVWLVISGMYGILPEPEVAYEPRAADWQYKPLLLRLAAISLTLLIGILIQDAELCWRLRIMEARGNQLAESMKPTTVPDENNAAKHYQRVVAMMEERKDADNAQAHEFEATLAQGGSFDEKTAEYFQGLEPVFKELREASQCESCCYDDDFIVSVFPDNCHANLTLSSAMARLNQYACWQSCKQHPLEAMQCIRIMRRWEDHLQQDPRNAESELFFWTERNIRDIVEQMALHCPALPQAELKALIAKPLLVDSIHESSVRWQAAVFQKSLPTVFDGRSYDRPELRETRFMASNSPMGILSRIVARFMLARDDLQSVQNQFSCLDTPYSRLTWAGCGQRTSIPHGYYSSVFWSLAMLRAYFAEADTNRTLANIGIAAALYHQDQKTWPTAIEQLTPNYLSKVPVDSTSGAKFLVMQVNGGLVIYTSNEQQYLAKAENDEQMWRELSQTTTPVLFLGPALERSQEAKR